jgi:hypothetical protein
MTTKKIERQTTKTDAHVSQNGALQERFGRYAVDRA